MIKGCFCGGGNTPELYRYCCCQQSGDRANYDAVMALMQPHLDKGNAAMGAGDERAAWNHACDAYEAAVRFQSDIAKNS